MTDDRESWRRGRVAPLAPLAFAVAAGVAADRQFGPVGTSTWSLSAVILAIVAALAWRSRDLAGLAIAAAFVALGGAWHHYWWSDLAPDDLARAHWVAGERRPAWVRGVPVEAAAYRPGDGGPGDRGATRTVLALTGINDGRGWRAVSGKVQASIAGDRSDLEPGRALEAAGVLSAIEGPANPGEVDFRPILRARGVRLRLSVDEPSGVWTDPTGADWPWTRRLGAIRAWSARRLSSGLDPSAVPLASALLLGRREAVDPEVNDAFARTGTTHLLAISGLHLQVLAVALGACARGFGMGRKGSYGVVIAGTVGYAVLVGLAPSVVRSAAMTVGACAAGWRDRCVGPANLMSGAALATLLHNPSDLFDVGCQLSFIAVAAILWLVPRVLDWDAPSLTPLDVLGRRLEPWWRMASRMGLAGLRAGLIGSAVVWLVGWPLVALRFHVVSPVAILINIPLIPLTSLALLLSGLTLLLSSVWPPLGTPFGWACGQCLGWTEAVVRRGTAWRWGHAFAPGPPWGWVLAFYALLGLATMAGACRWRARRALWAAAIACGAMMAALPLWPGRPGATEAEVLAVGHGLAVVVRSPGGATALYDCGKMGDPRVGRRLIAPALWSRGVRELDVVILSHADADHYNGLPDLLDRFPIGVVRVPPGFDGPSNPGAKALLDSVRARGIPVEPIAEGARIDLGGGTTLAAIHPREEIRPGSTDNARSVVLEVASGGRRLLLTGDLERDGLADVVAKPPGPFDAMLAPHHGGRTSNPAWLYQWARPAQVVVSQRPLAAGSRDPLEPIARGHFPLLRTWQSGAIRFRWSPSALVADGFLDPPAPAPTTSPTPWLPTPSKALAGLLGLAIGASLCLALTVVEWGAWSLVLPGRKHAKSKGPAGRSIHALALDGTRLAGEWFSADPDRGRILLLLHGLAEDRSALLGRVPAMVARGWDVALLDARAAGESEGRRGSFGTLESTDLLAWLDALTPPAGPPATFAAWGRSMGASTALRAAASDPRIAALILEAPYKALHPAVSAVLRRLRIPFPRTFAALIIRRAGMLAGVPLDSPRPIDLAPKVQAPALILHGEEDPIAPLLDARALALAFPRPAEVLEVPGAGHANVVGIGGDALMDRVGDFLERAAPPSTP
jgi:competence protein ComEC